LIFEKSRGFFAKLPGIIDFGIILLKKTRGPCPPSVHGGPRRCGRERGGARDDLTRDGAAVKRPGDSGKAAVMKVRGGGKLRRERGGKEGGVGCGEMRRGRGAFYRCRGGGKRPDDGGERTATVERHDGGGGDRFRRGSAEE
jgi:hypothetical protein